MTVQQMYQLLNGVLPSVLGQDDVQVTDVSSLGKFGKLVANMDKGYELFHGKMLDRCIKLLQDNDAFDVLDGIPFLHRESDWGGFIEEYYFDMPDAGQTTSWNVGDEHYAPSLPGVTKLPLTVKVYEKEVDTFSYEWTYPDKLLDSAFTSNEGMLTYIAGLTTTVENRVKLDILNLSRLVRARFLATIINTPGTESVVNVLSLFKASYPDSTVDEDTCWVDKDFLRFLAETMASYVPRLTKNPTSHYINEKTANSTDYVRQVKSQNLTFEILSDVIRKIRFNLESDTFNPEKLNFGDYTEQQYWVQAGDDSLADYSTISVKLGEDDLEQDIEVTQKGIVAIMYDNRSIMQLYRDPYRWSFRNQKDRYVTNGIQENFAYGYKLSYPTVIFVVADEDTP